MEPRAHGRDWLIPLSVGGTVVISGIAARLVALWMMPVETTRAELFRFASIGLHFDAQCAAVLLLSAAPLLLLQERNTRRALRIWSPLALVAIGLMGVFELGYVRGLGPGADASAFAHLRGLWDRLEHFGAASGFLGFAAASIVAAAAIFLVVSGLLELGARRVSGRRRDGGAPRGNPWDRSDPAIPPRGPSRPDPGTPTPPPSTAEVRARVAGRR